MARLNHGLQFRCSGLVAIAKSLLSYRLRSSRRRTPAQPKMAFDDILARRDNRRGSFDKMAGNAKYTGAAAHSPPSPTRRGRHSTSPSEAKSDGVTAAGPRGWRLRRRPLRLQLPGATRRRWLGVAPEQTGKGFATLPSLPGPNRNARLASYLNGHYFAHFRRPRRRRYGGNALVRLDAKSSALSTFDFASACLSAVRRPAGGSSGGRFAPARSAKRSQLGIEPTAIRWMSAEIKLVVLGVFHDAQERDRP